MTSLTNDQKHVLKQARNTYGDRNQIGVAIEELCELSAALSKFIRYDKSSGVCATRDAVMDEFADVLIVLDHVREIYNMQDDEIERKIDCKINRLQGWLQKSESMEQTTLDR